MTHERINIQFATPVQFTHCVDSEPGARRIKAAIWWQLGRTPDTGCGHVRTGSNLAFSKDVPLVPLSQFERMLPSRGDLRAPGIG